MNVDVAGWESLYEREYPRLLRALTAIAGDEGAAEDAVQEAFVRGYTLGLTTLERPGAWLLVVATRVLFRDRRRRLTDVAVETVPSKRDEIDFAIERADLLAALRQLPERQRAVVVARFYYDLSYEEIAKAFAIRTGTVGATLSQALGKLRAAHAARLAPPSKRAFTFQLAVATALIALGIGGALLGQTDLTRDSSVASGPRLAPITRAAPGAPVVVGHIEDAINPITARYVDRVIADAQAAGAPAVVFVINTPGGLIDSTYRITTAFLNAPLPVVTFVAPSGARAASAGTFITMAGTIAAMAPATNIGAAHPVDSSGGDIQGDLRLKAENDAAAAITKIAKARGRNEQWAEDAVRKSVSIRDDEALRLKVVDLVARDLPDLLTQIDGRSVQVNGQSVTLATKSAAIDDDAMNWFEAFLHLVVDPQISVLLFSLGSLALIFELQNPGLILPGIVGVISIVLALFSFGTLDANAAGVALMLFAIVLFIADIKMPTHGFLTAGAIASLVLGIIVLFPPARPTFPGLRYSADPFTIIFVVGVMALLFGYVVRAAVGFQRLPVASGSTMLVGTLGVAKTDLAPSGIVRAGGDEWTAVSEGGTIPQGAPVRVRRVDGVRLIVGPESSSGRRES